METILQFLIDSTSDKIMFGLLQFLISLLLIISIAKNRSTGITVTRGPFSMGIFYGAYGAFSGLLIAICLSVETDHKVFWVAYDTVVSAYICLKNPWSRNKLLEFVDFLKVEK